MQEIWSQLLPEPGEQAGGLELPWRGRPGDAPLYSAACTLDVLHDTKPVTIPVWDAVPSHMRWPWSRVPPANPWGGLSLPQLGARIYPGLRDAMGGCCRPWEGQGFSVIQIQPHQGGGVGHARAPEPGGMQGRGRTTGLRKWPCLSPQEGDGTRQGVSAHSQAGVGG